MLVQLVLVQLVLVQLVLVQEGLVRTRAASIQTRVTLRISRHSELLANCRIGQETAVNLSLSLHLLLQLVSIFALSF